MSARRLAVAAVLVALALVAPGAHADDTAEVQARSYFAIGQGHYSLGEYGPAIEAFQAGYRLKPQPLFLFNIAQAARKSGRAELAELYYARYLERESSARAAPQRAEAEAWLAKLRREAPAPPPAVAPAPAPAAEPAPPPPPAPAPAVNLAPSPPPAPMPALTATRPAPAPTPAPRPVWRRGWFWGTLAAAAVVVGTGVGVGTWLALESRGPAHPTLGAVDFPALVHARP